MKDFFEKLGKLIDAIKKLDIIEYSHYIMDHMVNDESDFENGGYRFIKESKIDDIVYYELVSDPYMLGNFKAEFISDNTDLSLDIVRTLQSAEEFAEIGSHIIDNGFLDDFVSSYIDADGYGHHFDLYDGNQIDDFLEFGYYCFRID